MRRAQHADRDAGAITCSRSCDGAEGSSWCLEPRKRRKGHGKDADGLERENTKKGRKRERDKDEGPAFLTRIHRIDRRKGMATSKQGTETGCRRSPDD